MNIIHRACLTLMLMEMLTHIRHLVNPELYPVSGYGAFGVLIVWIFILTPKDLFE